MTTALHNSHATARASATGRAACEWDAETGMYYYRARYYAPEMGRFISEDPIRFASGEVNWYAYVGNNPINAADPMGLHKEGGPEHNLEAIRCYENDSCAVLSKKIGQFKKIIAGHEAYDRGKGNARHDQEIRDLKNGLASCIDIHRRKCTDKCKGYKNLEPKQFTAAAYVAAGILIAGDLLLAGPTGEGLVPAAGILGVSSDECMCKINQLIE